jgi:hypothetical protein
MHHQVPTVPRPVNNRNRDENVRLARFKERDRIAEQQRQSLVGFLKMGAGALLILPKTKGGPVEVRETRRRQRLSSLVRHEFRTLGGRCRIGLCGSVMVAADWGTNMLSMRRPVAPRVSTASPPKFKMRGPPPSPQARPPPRTDAVQTGQGFLEFVKSRGDGPLFYDPVEENGPSDPLNPRRPPAVVVRQKVAAWVRGLGIADDELSPTHAWRHTFKQIADRAGISERMSDYITGHSHKTEGARYGDPTLEDMAAAMGKFPRYDIRQQ